MDGDERTTAIRDRRSSYRYVLPSTVHARLTIDARCVHILLDPLATRVHSPSFVVQIGNPPKNPPTVTLSLSMSLYLARSLKREKKKVPWRIEPFSFLLSGLIFHACPFHPCCFYMLLSMENLVHTHTHTHMYEPTLVCALANRRVSCRRRGGASSPTLSTLRMSSDWLSTAAYRSVHTSVLL